MKLFSKKLLTVLAVILSVSALTATALTGCTPKAQDFVFEAEEAILIDTEDEAATTAQGYKPMTLEKTTEWTEDGSEGPEVTNVGYFSSKGDTIKFVINSSTECTATLTLRAASGVADMATMDWNTFTFTMKEIDLSLGEVVKVTNNDAEVALTGILPSTPNSSWMNAACYHHFGEGKGNIKLKKGENVILLTIVGTMGINVDKITINAASELTFTKTDNSERLPSAA